MNHATTVKLPSILKKRIAPLAKAAGKSAHAWMVDTLACQVEREEARRSFVEEAVQSQKAVAKGEPVYSAEEVFAYARATLAGQQRVKRPLARRRSR